MIEIAVLLALIVTGIAYFELKGNFEGRVVYLIPSERFKRLIYRASTWIDWKTFGDIALAVIMGPLAFKKVERKRWYILFLLLAPFIARSVNEFFPYLFMGASGLALYYLFASALSILYGYLHGIHPAPGVGLLIPGLSIGPFRVPLVEGVIALLIALIVHEGAHGCVAVRRNIPITRAGVILLGFLPIGAFVDPSEHIFRKKNPVHRLHVLAAGPFANIVVGVAFFVLLFLLAPLSSAVLNYECTYGEGARILSVPKTLEIDGKEYVSPAYGILKDGDVVIFFEENRIHCASQLLDALSPFREREENATVSLVVLRGGVEKHVTITLNKGYLGVQGVETVLSSPPLWYYCAVFLISLVWWIAIVNMMIGIVNALPLPPLDGGQMFGIVYPRAASLLTALTLALLVINILPWFF